MRLSVFGNMDYIKLNRQWLIKIFLKRSLLIFKRVEGRPRMRKAIGILAGINLRSWPRNRMYSKKRLHLFIFALWVVKPMQQVKGDDGIKTIIEEVRSP